MATKKSGSVKKTDTLLTTSVTLSSEVTGTLSVANGGTGQSTFTNGQILVGVTSGNTLSKVSMSGDATLSNAGVLTIANSAVTNAKLANSAITIAGTSTALGASISLDTITGLSSTGIIKRTAANTLAIATSGTDYAAAGAVTGSGLTMATARLLGRSTASTGAIEEITVGSGLSLSAGTLALNTVAVSQGGTGATTLTGVLKGNGTSAFTAATAGTDYTSPSSTETFTNKTFDAEGTGNTLGLPVKVWLPAAGMSGSTAASFWDLPSSSPAVAATVAGTNTIKGVLDFADTGGALSAQTHILLPSDFTGNVDARIIWFTTATSGNCKWSLATCFTAIDATATDDPSFNTASTVTTAAPGTTNRITNSAITSLTITNSGVSKIMHLKISRDGGDGSDTIAATARLIGVEITFRRSI